jgi:hypothetical protein
MSIRVGAQPDKCLRDADAELLGDHPGGLVDLRAVQGQVRGLAARPGPGSGILARALSQGQLEFGELPADLIGYPHEVTRLGAARGAQPGPGDLNCGDGRRADIRG